MTNTQCTGYIQRMSVFPWILFSHIKENKIAIILYIPIWKSDTSSARLAPFTTEITCHQEHFLVNRINKARSYFTFACFNQCNCGSTVFSGPLWERLSGGHITGHPTCKTGLNHLTSLKITGFTRLTHRSIQEEWRSQMGDGRGH